MSLPYSHQCLSLQVQAETPYPIVYCWPTNSMSLQKMMFLLVICPLLSLQRRKLIRNNTVFKKIVHRRKGEVTGERCQRQNAQKEQEISLYRKCRMTPVRKTPAIVRQWENADGFHLHLILKCQHSNSDRENLRYWQQTLNVTLNSRKTCFCTVLLNN